MSSNAILALSKVRSVAGYASSARRTARRGHLGNLETYKALGEVALAAGLLRQGGTAGAREGVLAAELLDFCWDQLGEGALLYERLLHHPLTTDPVELYSHFTRAAIPAWSD